MPVSQVFVDTSYIQATLDVSDQYHSIAKKYSWFIDAVDIVWLTEAILSEVSDTLGNSPHRRKLAQEFIDDACNSTKIRVVNITSDLFKQGLELYRSRSDKTWGLIDCISFVVMQQEGISDALTTDHHFVQAGFRALLLEAS